MIRTVVDMLADDREFDGRLTRFLSLVFLAVAGVIAFGHYTRPNYFWIFRLPGNQTVSFHPGPVSGVIGISLLAPLYLRGMLRWSKSPYGIVSFALLLLVFSELAQFALGPTSSPGSHTLALLGNAVVLSWLGMRQVAGASWILAAGAAIGEMVASDVAVGFAGFVFVACGCMGLLLHTGLHPGQLVRGLRAEYVPSARLAAARAHDDVRSLADAIGSPSSPPIVAHIEDR